MNKLQRKRWEIIPVVLSLAVFLTVPAVVAQENETTETPGVDPGEKKLIATPEEAGKPKELGLIVREIEIQFVGPKTTSESIILANLRTKVGEPFTQSQSEDDVRSLYATGFFSNVKIYQERVDDGLKVIVTVQGKSKLKEIVFEGNKGLSDSRLRKEIKMKPGDTIGERQVAEGANTLVEFYQKAGFQNVKVAFETTPDELTGQTVVKYVVTEGSKIKIKRVNFEGNKAFEAKVLRKKIETGAYFWLTSWWTKKGILHETEVEEDKQRLVDFYRSEGYIDADIKDVKYDHPAANTMIVTFFIFEGNQYKVGKLTVAGNQLFTTNEVEKKFKMKAGDLFTPGGLQGNIKAIQDLYGNLGYIDCLVKPTRVPNIRTGTVDVSLEIQEGEMVYVDLVQVRGNVVTKDKVIRRELAVTPGEVYNSVKIDASKRRLDNLGFFSSVSVQPEDTDVPNRKNVVISVEEQNTGEISFGAGFSSIEAIFGFVELTQRNFDIAKPPYFRGAGQKARLRAQFGALSQNYAASFTEPWFLDKQLAVGFDLFYTEVSYFSSLYNERRYGFDIRAGKSLGEFNKIDLTYKLEEIELFDVVSTAHPTILAESGSRSKSSLSTVLTRDTRDSFILPGKGYKIELWSEVAGGPALGGDTDIYKWGLNGQIHFTMPWWEKNILSFDGSTGVVEEWDNANRVPIFDKFFLGGPGSVRGFRFRDVGPKDPSGGEPIGGKTMAYLQAEYSIPVMEWVRFATFADVGQVEEKAYDWGATRPDAGAGIGLRLNIPRMGQINLDYGWPISHDQFTGDNGQFSFSGGTKF